MQNNENIPIIQVTAPSYQAIPRSDETSMSNEAKPNSEFTPLLQENDNSKSLLAFGRDDKTSTRSELGSIQPEYKEPSKWKKGLNYFKIVVLTGTVFFGLCSMAVIDEPTQNFKTMVVSENSPTYLNVSTPVLGFLTLTLIGPFIPEQYATLSNHDMLVTLKMSCPGFNGSQIITTLVEWSIPIPGNNKELRLPDKTVKEVFDVRYFPESCNFSALDTTWKKFFLNFESNSSSSFPFLANVQTLTEVYTIGSIIAGVILVGFFILIGFELVPRTLAAMIASTISIVVLAILNEKPELPRIVSWIDVETLVLLFAMMVIVAILCETGFFDYIAVLAYKIAKGSQWPLITTLCFFTAFISAFLDNVTTILLITPVTIRLCEVMGLDPRHVLVCMVLFSNIGGTATPIGDPPNVIIISNPTILKSNIDFLVFTQHMAPGVIFCIITAYIFIRIYYSRGQMHFTDPPDVVDLRHEIDVWKRAYHSLPGYTHEEDVVRDTLERKINHLEKVLRKKIINKKPNEGEYKASLKELEEKYKIRNKPLLAKSMIVMVFVIMLFFTTSLQGVHVTLGWVALFGAMILLVLADFEEIESIFARVEWTTLVFFSALFVLMQAVEELGLLEIIGAGTEGFISSFSPAAQLNAAMLLLLWVSAIASSFMDNIPFTTAMIPVITRMSVNLDLPLQPLVWSLAFGACLGGNGSIIGASANVVCAGIAENHGYRFTFMHFFKVGFPLMLVTVITASVYLLICHSAIGWNY